MDNTYFPEFWTPSSTQMVHLSPTLRPEQLADKIILVGDPGRVALVASHFEEKECEVESREFKNCDWHLQG